MELKMIIKFEDREIVLTEEEAITLYNKLSEMFGKIYTYPVDHVYPQPMNPTYTTPVYTPLWSPVTFPSAPLYEIICSSTEPVNVPFMREVKPFTKEEMGDIRKELETPTTTTTCDINETQWINPNNMKLDGGTRSVDWSYYGNLTMGSVSK